MAYKKEPINEDELFDDEQYKIRTTNSRKSVASTYAYLIIKECTDANHHMTQKELAKRLAASPININLNRKAVSRMVYTLADSGVGIKALPKDGVWFDGDVWFNSAQMA